MLGGFRIRLRFRFLGYGFGGRLCCCRFLGVGIRSVHNRFICGFRGFWLHSGLSGLGALRLC